MKPKHLMRLTAALVGALVLWGIVAYASRASGDHAAGLVMPAMDTSGVDTMAFRTGPDSIVAVRQSNGRWLVNGYAASESMVRNTLAALADTTNWSELAARSRASDVAMGLSADSGQRVRVAVKGGAGLQLITGHRTSDYSGLFVRRPDDSAVYAFHGPFTQAVSHVLSDWRDRTIGSLVPDSIRRVEIARRGGTYSIARAGSGWTFSGGGTANSAAVSELLDRFHPLTATGFATVPQADSLQFTRPAARVRVYGGSNVPLMILVIDSTSAGAWVRADTGGVVYAIQSWTLDQLAPAEKALRAGAPKAR